MKNHNLIPKHTKISEKERDQILSKLNITANMLPKISIDDPVIVDCDVKCGDIVKIERKSLTAGKSNYYRLVVEE